jgi:hypothetical protein
MVPRPYDRNRGRTSGNSGDRGKVEGLEREILAGIAAIEYLRRQRLLGREGAVVTALNHNFQHDTDVLIRQVDNHLASLLMTPGQHDVELAERLAASLRALVVATARASAADRARVRAGVHYFVLRRDTRHDRRPARSLTEDLRVVNRIARDLGRDDLVIPAEGFVTERA